MKLTLVASAIAALSSFQILADGSVTGIVRDADGPLSGAKITVAGSLVQTATDDGGKFTLSHLSLGKQRLTIHYLGYSSQAHDVTVLDQETVQLGELNLGEDESTMEEVVTLGYMRRGAMQAVNMQKESNNITNFLSADGIGKLPDRNAAEAVQRMPGISIERDQGEGRFVAIRGLPAQWNSTSINGDRLPTAEEETTSRAVAFDFFPTDMVELVEVSKAITPDMEGDAMGGGILTL